MGSVDANGPKNTKARGERDRESERDNRQSVFFPRQFLNENKILTSKLPLWREGRRVGKPNYCSPREDQ